MKAIFTSPTNYRIQEYRFENLMSVAYHTNAEQQNFLKIKNWKFCSKHWNAILRFNSKINKEFCQWFENHIQSMWKKRQYIPKISNMRGKSRFRLLKNKIKLTIKLKFFPKWKIAYRLLIRYNCDFYNIKDFQLFVSPLTLLI